MYTKEELTKKIGEIAGPLENITFNLNEKLVDLYSKEYPESIEKYWNESDYNNVFSTGLYYKLILYHLDDLLNLPITGDDLCEVKELMEVLNKVMTHIEGDILKIYMKANNIK